MDVVSMVLTEDSWLPLLQFEGDKRDVAFYIPISRQRLSRVFQVSSNTEMVAIEIVLGKKYLCLRVRARVNAEVAA
ncbi:hypothetical protein KI387_011552, partial [Taxus chinensis]